MKVLLDSCVQVCLRVLASHEAELETGAIITAEMNRLRVRPGEVNQ